MPEVVNPSIGASPNRPYDGPDYSFYHVDRHLTGISGGQGRVAEKVRDTLNAEPTALAAALVSIARENADFVRALLEGRITTAVSMTPASGFGKYKRRQVICFVGEAALLHHIGNLWDYAQAGFKRLYAPTSLADLDDNGHAVVTVHSAATVMRSDSIDLTNVLKLEREARKRSLTAEELDTIERHGVLDEAAKAEGELRAIFGAGFDDWYEEVMAIVRRRAGYIRRGSKALASAKKMQKYALHLVHGPAALPVFYLSILYAVAWAQGVKQHETPLDRAIISLFEGERVVMPSVHKRHATVARELFFLLRSVQVRDPRAFPRGGKRIHRNDLIEDLIMDKHAELDAQHSGEEPFRLAPVVTAARKLSVWLKDKKEDERAIRIRTEVLGVIARQLLD